MMADLLKTFTKAGDFAAMHAAEEFMALAGFSVGRHQGPAPRGLLFGDFDIQKWRNLSASDRAALHGEMTGDMRSGPVTVRIFGRAPQEAKKRFHLVAVTNAAKELAESE